jgi:hypothetical protein
MTGGAASLSFIPMGASCNRFRKLPRVESAEMLTATFLSLQASIVIRLHRSRSILWARFFLQRAIL